MLCPALRSNALALARAMAEGIWAKRQHFSAGLPVTSCLPNRAPGGKPRTKKHQLENPFLRHREPEPKAREQQTASNTVTGFATAPARNVASCLCVLWRRFTFKYGTCAQSFGHPFRSLSVPARIFAARHLTREDFCLFVFSPDTCQTHLP